MQSVWRESCLLRGYNRCFPGAQPPEAHFDLFRDWQESTKNIRESKTNPRRKMFTLPETANDKVVPIGTI